MNEKINTDFLSSHEKSSEFDSSSWINSDTSISSVNRKSKNIYLDANGSSKLRPEVLDFYRNIAEIEDRLLNPSAVHFYGRKAKVQIEKSRISVAKLINLDLSRAELSFTSGGSESCNTLIFGFLGYERAQLPSIIITTSFEHSAIEESLTYLSHRGYQIRKIKPNFDNSQIVAEVLSLLDLDTQMICLIHSNNESGQILPIEEIARAVRNKGYNGLIVSDLTQSITKTNVNANNLFDAGIDAISFTGHKFGGPHGVGIFAFNKSKDRCNIFTPIIKGGPQENRLRAGTENTLAISALGSLCDSLVLKLDENINYLKSLRDYFFKLVSEQTSITLLTPIDKTECLSNTLLIRLNGIRGDDFVVAMDLEGVAISTGSVCSSGKQNPSKTALALGMSKEEALQVVRISFDWSNTVDQVETAAQRFINVCRRMS